MGGLLRTLSRIVPSPRSRSGPDAAPDVVVPSSRGARALAAAIDDAVRCGQWARAERIASTADRLAPDCPRLLAAMARLRLARGDVHAALDLTQDAGGGTDTIRLLHATCLVHLGRKARAHRMLRRVARGRQAPAAARLLLAGLEWEEGDRHAASLTLLRTLARAEARAEPPEFLAFLLLLAIEDGRPEQAQRWARRLAGATGTERHFEILRRSVGLAGEPAAPTRDGVEHLARELRMTEEAMPALVEAQSIAPDPETLALLRRAIEHGLDGFIDRAAAIECLVRLAHLAGDVDAARRWVADGLRRSPMSATLQRLARSLAAAPLENTPRRAAVLAAITPDPQDRAA